MEIDSNPLTLVHRENQFGEDQNMVNIMVKEMEFSKPVQIDLNEKESMIKIVLEGTQREGADLRRLKINLQYRRLILTY